MIIPVNNLGQFGINVDLPPQELALNVWTDGENVRFRNGVVEKFSGHSEVFATPSWAPYWLLPVPTGTAFYWLYASAAKLGATNGASHADITRTVGGDYSTDLDVGWTGTVIEGKAVVTNGADVPQYWAPDLGTPASDLSAWNANWRCRAMRSLKRYLVALDVTKSGTRYPYMIKWSDAAPSNGVPTSWDETDETIDAGEWQLSAEGGYLVDGCPLRDDLVLYKEYQTWLMQYVGGIDVFRFVKRFNEIGMLARKCAVEFSIGKQLVFTGNDVVVHDGQQGQSIIDKRLLNSITGQIDSTYFQRSFVAMNFPKREVWVCVPETGSSVCTKALVWNWADNVWGVRDLPNAAFIASGIVNPVDATQTWASAVGTWDTDSEAWGDRAYDPVLRKMLMAVPGSTKLYLPDDSQQFDGTNMTAYVEKVGIGFPLKQGGPPDYTTEKQVLGIWPRISGTEGGVVNVYLGTQERVDGPVTWQEPFPFYIGETEYVDPDPQNASKLHALKFESTSNLHWTLDGYDVDVVAVGKHGNR